MTSIHTPFSIPTYKVCWIKSGCQLGFHQCKHGIVVKKVVHRVLIRTKVFQYWLGLELLSWYITIFQVRHRSFHVFVLCFNIFSLLDTQYIHFCVLVGWSLQTLMIKAVTLSDSFFILPTLLVSLSLLLRIFFLDTCPEYLLHVVFEYGLHSLIIYQTLWTYNL